MPRPKLTKNMTTTQVARHLRMKRGQLVSWVEHGALPAASSVDNNGVRYFNEQWLERAREILRNKRSD